MIILERTKDQIDREKESLEKELEYLRKKIDNEDDKKEKEKIQLKIDKIKAELADLKVEKGELEVNETTTFIKNLSLKSGKSIDTLESYWNEAKKQIDKPESSFESKDWAIVTSIVKKRAGIKEDHIYYRGTIIWQ